MKKHLIITGIICIATIPPATAVTKCVNLSSSTTCSDASGSGSQWTATCNEIPVSGVAFCSNKKGTSSGAKSSTLTASTTSNANKYCWIKMTSPAVSQWVFYMDLGTTDGCLYNCARNTSMYLERATSSIKNSLFSSLSD